MMTGGMKTKHDETSTVYSTFFSGGSKLTEYEEKNFYHNDTRKKNFYKMENFFSENYISNLNEANFHIERSNYYTLFFLFFFSIIISFLSYKFHHSPNRISF